jgi:hypothetical protein
VTNNAVAALEKDGHTVFYSFYGMDSTKRWSGVHNKVFRVDPESGESSVAGVVPDAGRLAASASVIGNKAYLAGGYAVFESGKEKSSDHLFIFDPKTESFTRGASLPLPIDDHVQGVWREQLLFVLSGWTDSLNTNAVQVYDPGANQWQLATPLPEESGGKVFGASGLIVGDTIYFLGGATFAKYYPPSRSFYKGIIDPLNPLRINWLHAGEYPGAYRYRSTAFRSGDRIIFAGGSNETYNYDGISYDGKKPVEPNDTQLLYSIRTGRFTTLSSSLHTMDLRNAATTAAKETYVVGGMTTGQRVSDKVRKIEFP